MFLLGFCSSPVLCTHVKGNRQQTRLLAKKVGSVPPLLLSLGSAVSVASLFSLPPNKAKTSIMGTSPIRTSAHFPSIQQILYWIWRLFLCTFPHKYQQKTALKVFCMHLVISIFEFAEAGAAIYATDEYGNALNHMLTLMGGLTIII